MSPRGFRTPESYQSEAVTRDLLKGFIEARGFTNVIDDRKSHGSAQSQIIKATAPNGECYAIKVRLCWRRRKASDTYSAAQIIPEVKNDDWEGTLREKIRREYSEGVTHFLFIQRELGDNFSYAALIPLAKVIEVWCEQRDISQGLIEQGRLGRRTKNHAMNGSSPTLWLHDVNAREVTDALWRNPDVIDLLNRTLVSIDGSDAVLNDTFQDLPGIDPNSFGSETPPSHVRQVSGHVRDTRVRKAVVERAQGKCERPGCTTSKNFPGFFDVHHILGVGTSDRVNNCVALCPNCHREAHFSPDHDDINANLLKIARRKSRSA